VPRPTSNENGIRNFAEAALLVLENAKLRRPIRECLAQSLDIGIAGQDLPLDSRDLAARSLDSFV
jgi:hypothetical protein